MAKKIQRDQIQEDMLEVNYEKIINKPSSFTPSTHNHDGSYLGIGAMSGLSKITVGTTPPSNPQVGDLWVDTN